MKVTRERKATSAQQDQHESCEIRALDARYNPRNYLKKRTGVIERMTRLREYDDRLYYKGKTFRTLDGFLHES